MKKPVSRSSKKNRKNGYAFVWDIVIIAIGIILAFVLSKIGAIDAMVSGLRDYSILASFIAGLFFTSAFTLAPASIALVNIAGHTPVHTVALWGALGAMCGDLILLFFIKDKFFNDLINVLKSSKVKHILHSFHFGFLKWLSPLVGALIIASPLPDEFGIALMGISKVKVWLIMPVAFIMNALGIYALIGFANLIS